MAKVQGIHCATLACGSCSVWWYLVFQYFCVDCEQQQQQQQEVESGEQREGGGGDGGEQAREAIVAWGAAGSAGGAQSNETVVLALGGFEKNQVGCCAKR